MHPHTNPSAAPSRPTCAPAVFLQELRAAGEYDKIGQAFVVLLPCKSVGVMGDARTYEQVVALRAVATSDFMTADCELAARAPRVRAWRRSRGRAAHARVPLPTRLAQSTTCRTLC